MNEIALREQFDFDLEPVFEAYSYTDLIQSSLPIQHSHGPSFERVLDYHDQVVQYYISHEEYSSPLLLMNMNRKLESSELKKVLHAFRMFHQDNYGEYHLFPWKEVW